MTHFKKLTCLILALILAFSLAGCGSEKSAVEKVIKTYTDGARTFDLQKMASCADGADAGSGSIAESSPELVEIIKSWLSEMKYSVTKTTIDGDTATVVAAYTYQDAKGLMEGAYLEYYAEALERIYGGEEPDAEALNKLFIEKIKEVCRSTSPVEAKANVEFKLKKTSGGWKITGLSESAETVFSCNIIAFIESLDN